MKEHIEKGKKDQRKISPSKRWTYKKKEKEGKYRESKTLGLAFSQSHVCTEKQKQQSEIGTLLL